MFDCNMVGKNGPVGRNFISFYLFLSSFSFHHQLTYLIVIKELKSLFCGFIEG